VHHSYDAAGPLPFANDGEIIRLFAQYPMGDLVESTAAFNTGLHPENPPLNARGPLDPDQGESLHDEPRRAGHVQRDHDHGDQDQRDHDQSCAATREYHEPADERAPREFRRSVLAIDRFERREFRDGLRREREHRRAVGLSSPGRRSRRSPPEWTRDVDPGDQRGAARDTDLRDAEHRRRRADPRRRGRLMPTDPSGHTTNDVAAHPPALNRRRAALQGVALSLYVGLLPYVVVTKWRASGHQSNVGLLRTMLIMLSLFWLGFLFQVLRNVIRLRQGRDVRAGASAWIAGVLVALLSLVAATGASPLLHRAPTEVRITSPGPGHFTHHDVRAPLGELSGLSLALAAKRRFDDLRRGQDEGDVDESIALLRGARPEDLARLATLTSDRNEGSFDLPLDLTQTPPALSVAPTVVVASRSRLHFAREGGRLVVPTGWHVDELVHRLVALHDGPVRVTRDESELVRALATRSLQHSLVVFLGAPEALDQDLVACCVTLANDVARHPDVAHATLSTSSEIVVELLRADPTILGLHEPFVAALRRRCVEMTAYLALHRNEPVTGERLRTRVLVHADVDASQRTLANTASAVRRSLGADERGPRLHPVSSSGLYLTHGLTSDVERFGELVARARRSDVAGGALIAQRALALVKGEVLASALRGFEWFLAEGHSARLARDAEWAALLVHHETLRQGNFEVAFWALQQGLLVDPYSDALREALVRVPRLREFGRDRTGRAQDEAVGAESAVAMSWSFTGLSKQVFQ